MSLVRVQRKGAVTLPSQLRNRLGLNEGDLVEVKLQGTATIVIKPQLVIDRSKNTELLAALRAVQEDAKRKGLDKLTMREINAEVAAVRRQRQKKIKSPVR